PIFQPSQLLVQPDPRDAEHGGGAGPVAAAVLQYACDVLVLEVAQGDVDGRKPGLGRCACCGAGDFCGQVLGSDAGVGTGEDESTLEDVTHLADVAGPVVVGDAPEGVTVDCGVAAGCDLAQQVACESFAAGHVPGAQR